MPQLVLEAVYIKWPVHALGSMQVLGLTASLHLHTKLAELEQHHSSAGPCQAKHWSVQTIAKVMRSIA